MLRHIPSSELPSGSAPAARALVAPEAAHIARTLAQAAHHDAALSALRAQLRARLNARLLQAAKAPGQLDEAALSAILDEQLERLAHVSSIEVRLHPDDAEAIETEAALAARHALTGCLRIVADASLARGGCVIASSSGEVDARIETRIERLCAQLVEGSWR